MSFLTESTSLIGFDINNSIGIIVIFAVLAGFGMLLKTIGVRHEARGRPIERSSTKEAGLTGVENNLNALKKDMDEIKKTEEQDEEIENAEEKEDKKEGDKEKAEGDEAAKDATKAAEDESEVEKEEILEEEHEVDMIAETAVIENSAEHYVEEAMKLTNEELNELLKEENLEGTLTKLKNSNQKTGLTLQYIVSLHRAIVQEYPKDMNDELERDNAMEKMTKKMKKVMKGMEKTLKTAKKEEKKMEKAEKKEIKSLDKELKALMHKYRGLKSSLTKKIKKAGIKDQNLLTQLKQKVTNMGMIYEKAKEVNKTIKKATDLLLTN